jgi:hypothetical protein
LLASRACTQVEQRGDHPRLRHDVIVQYLRDVARRARARCGTDSRRRVFWRSNKRKIRWPAKPTTDGMLPGVRSNDRSGQL